MTARNKFFLYSLLGLIFTGRSGKKYCISSDQGRRHGAYASSRKGLFGFFFVWLVIAGSANAAESAKPTFIESVKHRLTQIWDEGTVDLYITGYAWHNRYTYDADKIPHYNEFAAGGGLGRGFIDEDGDWHALYAMGFSDSHRNFQPLAGYGFLKMFYLPQTTRVGAGFTWFATARKDIFHGIPFVGIPLPMISLGLRQASVFATYVPGGENYGNVLFVFGKWTF